MAFFTTLASGRDFHFSAPAPDMICLRDIAHHLSRLNRWGGNIEWASYSIAQHALLVTRHCHLPQSRPYALLANAPEMITANGETGWHVALIALDLSPMGYKRLLLKKAFYPAFGLEQPSSEINADIDRAAQTVTATEWRDVVAGKSAGSRPPGLPASSRIKFMPQHQVEEKYFLALQSALRPFGMVD